MLFGPKFEAVKPPPTIAEIIEPFRDYDDVGIPLHTVTEEVFRLVGAFESLLMQFNEQTSVLEEATTTVTLLLDRNAALQKQIAAVENTLQTVGCTCDCSCPAAGHYSDCLRESDCPVCFVRTALARAKEG